MRNAKDFGPFLRIVFAYLAASLLWVLLSDQAVNKLLPLSYVAAAQTWKGWFFVSVTTVLLYVLLRRVHRQMCEAAERELGAVQREARSALLLRNLVDSSGDAIFAKDPEGRYLVFNRAAEQLSGKVADEVLGRDDTVVFPADEAAKLRANDQYVMGQAEPVESEDTLSTVRGPTIFHTIKGALRDDSGVLGVYGVARDVTEMVHVREALQRSERRYRQMFEVSPLAMWVLDAERSRFLDVNAAAVLQYGFSREEFLEMPLERLQPPSQLVDLHQDFNRQEAGPGEASGEGLQSWLHRCKDGHLIEVELSSCTIEFEGRDAQLTLAVDVSTRNRLQRERDVMNRRLAQVLERVTDAFVSIDREQRLTYVNDRAALWFAPGTPAESLQGRVVWDLVPEAIGTPFQDAVLQALDTGVQTVAEDWYSPWKRWMELRVYPSSQGATGYFTDVSARRASEEVLKQSRRELSALSHQLLNQERITHERVAQALHDRLGQALGSARLYYDVVRARGTEAPDALDHLGKSLEVAVGEVRHVLRDLRPPLLCEQGLRAAIDNELLHSPAGALGVETRLLAEGGLERVRWPGDVEYAAFMIAREAITNALRHARARHLTVRLDGDSRRLHLSVADDGVGITEDQKAGSPGHLGLVGMRERAGAVGADLQVTGRAGQGTTVEMVVGLDR